MSKDIFYLFIENSLDNRFGDLKITIFMHNYAKMAGKNANLANKSNCLWFIFCYFDKISKPFMRDALVSIKLMRFQHVSFELRIKLYYILSQYQSKYI